MIKLRSSEFNEIKYYYTYSLPNPQHPTHYQIHSSPTKYSCSPLPPFLPHSYKYLVCMFSFGLFRLSSYSLLYKITIYLADEQMLPNWNQLTLRGRRALRQILLPRKLYQMSAGKSPLQNLPANTYPPSEGLLPRSRVALRNGRLFQLPFRRSPLLPKYKRLPQPTILYYRTARPNFEAEWYQYI